MDSSLPPILLDQLCLVAQCGLPPPEPSQVELGVGEQKSVMTFMGSPAPEFTADVSCQRRR